MRKPETRLVDWLLIIVLVAGVIYSIVTWPTIRIAAPYPR